VAEELRRVLTEIHTQEPSFGPAAFLLAALKTDFYSSKGLLVRSPRAEQLLMHFDESSCPNEEVQRLLGQVSLAPGPLRDRLTRRD
jgi:hypothetical protein